MTAAEQHGLPENEHMPYAESKGDAPPLALHADRHNDPAAAQDEFSESEDVPYPEVKMKRKTLYGSA